jgi:uncharacterized protein YerC
MSYCTSFESYSSVDVHGTSYVSIDVSQAEIKYIQNERCIGTLLGAYWENRNLYKISTHSLHTTTKLHISASQTYLMSKLSFAEDLSSYSAITRSLNLNMKQVPQDMVFQATSLLKQGKSVPEVEELTGLSKSTVGRLRKTHCTGVIKPKGVDARCCLQLMNIAVYVRSPKIVFQVLWRWQNVLKMILERE